MRGMHPDTNPTEPARGWRSGVPLLSLAVAATLVPLVGAGADAAAGPDDAVLRQGAEVYLYECQSCHQPGGVGDSGKTPPLVGNPNVDDAAYVETVIREGRTGEITVDGTTYNRDMPAKSTLSDADIEAVIAYIQSGFAAPAGPVAEVDTGPVAGTDLPILADYAWILGMLVALGAVVLVLGPRLVAANDRRQITWADAWLKTSVIVIGLILVTTIIPNKVLELDTVQELSNTGQDLIAVGIWGFALAASLWALWYAHREKRI